MGCDIHFFIEYDSKGKLPFSDTSEIELETTGDFFLPRDYDLFAALSGVRSQSPLPKFPPRGFPSPVSEALFEEYFSNIVEPGDKPLSDYDELREHVNDYVQKGYSELQNHPVTKKEWVSCPDWHTPSWLYLSEFLLALDVHSYLLQSEQLTQALKIMENIEKMCGRNRVRAVFWFDN
ncbi:hypothetical protein [Pleionea sp. CnH1-48]|uniref:hypothetical protein n=1 Tax=Pleionea sp. CnH1-48 TaxID=2954494 RepID=UPI002097F87E|nr:hypothetical protein [Pleionea sp. CnH1-48]MCO7226977.1 hypothetical protein [Pleionea sp. CnH1-48]